MARCRRLPGATLRRRSPRRVSVAGERVARCAPTIDAMGTPVLFPMNPAIRLSCLSVVVDSANHQRESYQPEAQARGRLGLRFGVGYSLELTS